jgi:DNA invertase Pin-like site-specific DNA recombinase
MQLGKVRVAQQLVKALGEVPDGGARRNSTDKLDSSTTAGKAMFQMPGVFAEFERGIIRERVNAGLARARAKGTKLGRRRVEPSIEARILELRAGGDGILKIGRKLGIGTSVVQRVVAPNRASRHQP